MFCLINKCKSTSFTANHCHSGWLTRTWKVDRLWWKVLIQELKLWINSIRLSISQDPGCSMELRRTKSFTELVKPQHKSTNRSSKQSLLVMQNSEWITIPTKMEDTTMLGMVSKVQIAAIFAMLPVKSLRYANAKELESAAKSANINILTKAKAVEIIDLYTHINLWLYYEYLKDKKIFYEKSEEWFMTPGFEW